MDHAKQVNEMEVILNRARRAGMKVYHYPDEHLAVIRVPKRLEVVEPPLTLAADPAPASEKA